MSKKQRGQYCAVVGCNNSQNNPPGTVFYTFPTVPHRIEQRQKWIEAVRRINPDGSPWQPTKYSRICSRHFIGNAKSFHPKSPSFVPTIFPKIYGTKRKNGKTAASAKDSDDSDQPNSSTHSAGKNDNIEIFKAEDMQKEDMLSLSTDPLAVGNAGKNYIFIKTEDNLEPADTNESSAVTYNDVKVECPELSDLKEVDPSDDIPYVDTEEYKIFFIDKDISSLNQTTDSTPGKRPGPSQVDLGNCPQKRKRTAVSEGESTKGDKSHELGKCWTTIHRKLVPEQQRIAERAIISILSEACRGKLNQNSVVINGVSIKDL